MKLILIAIMLFGGSAFAQTLNYVPEPIAAYVSTDGVTWNPSPLAAGYGALLFTPTPRGLYCQASANAAWTPCLFNSGGGSTGTVSPNTSNNVGSPAVYSTATGTTVQPAANNCVYTSTGLNNCPVGATTPAAITATSLAITNNTLYNIYHIGVDANTQAQFGNNVVSLYAYSGTFTFTNASNGTQVASITNGVYQGSGFKTGVSGNTDLAGVVTLASGTTTSPAITFTSTYSVAPVCQFFTQNATVTQAAALGTIATQVSTTTASATVSTAPAVAITLGYHCIGRS